MYETKVGRAYRRGCLRGCGVQVVGLVLGVALVVSVLLLIDGGRVEPRSARFTLALLMPAILALLMIGVAAIWVVARGRRLDRAFAPLGWSGRQAGAAMRSWHGDFGGRDVDVWMHRGPTLEIYVTAGPATRGVIHTGGPVIRAIGEALDKHPPLDPPPFALDEATFYCHDPRWMRRLFERAVAENAVRALMSDTERTASAVFFLPESVRYVRRFMPLSEITAERVAAWLAELSTLAGEVDRLGPSADGLEPKRLEHWARKRRGRFMNLFLVIMGAVLFLGMGSLFVFGWFFVGQ